MSDLREIIRGISSSRDAEALRQRQEELLTQGFKSPEFGLEQIISQAIAGALPALVAGLAGGKRGIVEMSEAGWFGAAIAGG